MPKRALEDFTIGERAEFSRTFTETDVAQFVGITWDVNPYHTDDEFCKTHRVGKRSVPGLLVGSLLTHIGGLAAVLASHIAFEFIAPVFIGDTITATDAVVGADATRGWARIEMTRANQDGQPSCNFCIPSVFAVYLKQRQSVSRFHNHRFIVEVPYAGTRTNDGEPHHR